MAEKEKTVNRIREFNRFYTVLLGFLNRNYLDSGYSVTETRILFEIRQNGQISASRLIEMLHLDKSYISRLIRNFEQKEIVIRKTCPDDGRALTIQLTPKGQKEADRLISITNQMIYELIEPLSSEACGSLCGAMETIIGCFGESDSWRENNHGKRE